MHKSCFERAPPFLWTHLTYGLSNGCSKSDVAIEHRDLDLELSNLPIEVSSHEALAKQFDAVHLCLCAAPAVIPGQLSPECPSEIFAGPHSFVSRDGARRG